MYTNEQDINTHAQTRCRLLGLGKHGGAICGDVALTFFRRYKRSD